MHITVRTKAFDFFAGTRSERIYSARWDEFTNIKPGIRLHIHTKRHNLVLSPGGVKRLNCG